MVLQVEVFAPPPPATLTARGLSFIFNINSTSSGPVSQPQTITIPSGLMASARIAYAGLPGANSLECAIWGLTPDIMNQLNTLGMKFQQQPRNLITVMAGNADGTHMSVAFKGGIQQGLPDFSRQPEIPIHITAWTAIDIATLPSKAKSFEGESDIVTMAQILATEVGYGTVETNGISGVMLSNSYLHGSPKDQLLQIQTAIKNRGIWIDIVENNTVAIWNVAKGRGQTAVPLIGPNNGLIGYPSYTQFGIDFRCIYTSNIRQGGQVQVQSTLPSADGLWIVYGLSHDLDAQIPGGKWETTVHAYRVGYPVPPITPP